MMKSTWTFVAEQLDRLFFLPLSENESLELRETAIVAMLTSSGWTWDQVLDQMYKSEAN